jgi:hypothetical protein
MYSARLGQNIGYWRKETKTLFIIYDTTQLKGFDCYEYGSFMYGNPYVAYAVLLPELGGIFT